MPFNVSNPVLYYNKKAFQQAGLDPEKPPTTLDEVAPTSQKIVDTGATTYGYALKLDPWYLEQWLAKAGKPYVNNGNGREKRADRGHVRQQTGARSSRGSKDMVDDKLALNTGPPEGNIDNLLAIGNGERGDDDRHVGDARHDLQVLGSGQFPDVELGVAPMPGPSGKGGVLVGGAALYIVEGSRRPRSRPRPGSTSSTSTSPQRRPSGRPAPATCRSASRRSTMPPLKARGRRTRSTRSRTTSSLTGVNNVATAGPVIGRTSRGARRAWSTR